MANLRRVQALRFLSSREFAEKARAILTHQLAKDLDKTLTQIESLYIITLFDIGMETVFPKEKTTK